MISFTFHNGFDSIGLIFNFVVKMGKLPQISKASKSNVILLKQEGYKNVEISKRLKLSEASVSRILERNKQNLSLSPLKRSGRPRTTTPRTDVQNQTTLPKATIHFFIRNKKIYARAD